MVHASESSFEVGASRVDFFFDILASSFIIMFVDRLPYIFMCRLNPFDVSLNISRTSTHGKPMFVRMEVHSLSIPFIRAIGL